MAAGGQLHATPGADVRARDLLGYHAPAQPEPDRLDEPPYGRNVVHRWVEQAPGQQAKETMLKLVPATEDDDRGHRQGRRRRTVGEVRIHQVRGRQGEIAHRAQPLHATALYGNVLGGHRRHHRPVVKQFRGIVLVLLAQVEGEREVRRHRTWPTAFSSALIRWLTADGVTCSERAAASKLPSTTTAANVVNWTESSAMLRDSKVRSKT